MVVKAAIVHIFKAKRHMCHVSKNHFPIVQYEFALSFVAKPNKTHNVLVLETCKVPELLLKLLIVKSRHGTKQLHRDRFTIFMHTLLNIQHGVIINMA